MLIMNKRRELSAHEKDTARRLKAAWQSKKDNLGLTQETMAFECGWKTQGAFSQYINARVPLNLTALLKICNILGLNPANISAELMSDVGGIAIQSLSNQPTPVDTDISGDLSSLMPTASPNTHAVLARIKLAADKGELTEQDMKLLDAISRRFASDKSRSNS